MGVSAGTGTWAMDKWCASPSRSMSSYWAEVPFWLLSPSAPVAVGFFLNGFWNLGCAAGGLSGEAVVVVALLSDCFCSGCAFSEECNGDDDELGNFMDLRSLENAEDDVPLVGESDEPRMLSASSGSNLDGDELANDTLDFGGAGMKSLLSPPLPRIERSRSGERLAIVFR